MGGVISTPPSPSGTKAKAIYSPCHCTLHSALGFPKLPVKHYAAKVENGSCHKTCPRRLRSAEGLGTACGRHLPTTTPLLPAPLVPLSLSVSSPTLRASAATWPRLCPWHWSPSLPQLLKWQIGVLRALAPSSNWQPPFGVLPWSRRSTAYSLKR